MLGPAVTDLSRPAQRAQRALCRPALACACVCVSRPRPPVPLSGPVQGRVLQQPCPSRVAIRSQTLRWQMFPPVNKEASSPGWLPGCS